jgi:hypothetical protein
MHKTALNTTQSPITQPLSQKRNEIMMSTTENY